MKAIGLTIVSFATLIATIVTYEAAGKSLVAVQADRCPSHVDCRPPSALSKGDQESHLVSQLPMMDRSRKGNRLDTITAAVKSRAPTGCESPFSSLANLARPNLIARCVT